VSLAVCATCPQGIALSVDSRLSAFASDDSAYRGGSSPSLQRVSDGVRKLAVFHDRYILGWCGGTDGTPVGTFLARLAADPEIVAAREPEAFIAAMLKRSQTRDARLALITWHDDDGTARVGYLEGDAYADYNRDEKTGQCKHFAFPVGVVDTVKPLIMHRRVRYDQLALQDAVDFSRWLIEVQAGAQQFEFGAKTVGGPIYTAIATPGEGARIVDRPAIELRRFGLALGADEPEHAALRRRWSWRRAG
jgi:hypothetical protein